MLNSEDGLRTVIFAPMNGKIVPLEDVPDPVFSQKMVGDGIAIDPLDSILGAPCDGEIKQVFPAGHGVTILADGGVQILIHVGIDTIELKGRGFSPIVKKGDRVTVGAPLIEFDLDLLASRAKSLLTPVVITNSAGIVSLEKDFGMVEAGRDPIFSVILESGSRPTSNGRMECVMSSAILIENPLGLHARPAAELASTARSFRGDVNIHFGERQANAKSVTSIMALDVGQGAKVRISARGEGAAAAITKLTELLEPGFGEGHLKLPPDTGSFMKPVAPGRWPRSDDPNVLHGVPASPGIGVGNVFRVRFREIRIEENADDPDFERELLSTAIGRARAQLAALQTRSGPCDETADKGIFAAHAELAQDPALLEVARSAIAKGKTAAFAWKSAFESAAKMLADMPTPSLAQRAADLRDVGSRVLELLTGKEQRNLDYPQRAVLVAEDLSPSDTAFLDSSRIMGFCTTGGGPASHVATLARSLGIPALAAMDPRVLDVPDGTLVILDADHGTLRLEASLAEMNEIMEERKLAEEEYYSELTQAHNRAITLDGHEIEVVANIAAVEIASRIGALGGEGIGLMRSEFLYLDRSSAPEEDEQYEAYMAVSKALGAKRRVNIRTLDVGGNRTLPYLPLPAEEIPFLGKRGIRIGLDHPEILRVQLRAILRAAAFGNLHVMFPKVATLDELRDAKAMLREEAKKLGVDPVPVGIVVEIPATALMAAQFAKEADFLSIGMNDLTQFTLAMDRRHPMMAGQVDGLNPAVLRLIEHTVTGAHAHGKPVGVCGGIAGDTQALPIVVGLGVDALSVNLPSIPAVKARIRELEFSFCRELAREALECDTAAEVRALVPSRERNIPNFAEIP